MSLAKILSKQGEMNTKHVVGERGVLKEQLGQALTHVRISSSTVSFGTPRTLDLGGSKFVSSIHSIVADSNSRIVSSNPDEAPSQCRLLVLEKANLYAYEQFLGEGSADYSAYVSATAIYDWRTYIPQLRTTSKIYKFWRFTLVKVSAT